MVMPVTEEARFDGVARGWRVFEPGSEHRPTVTNGEAIVLYMLPEGRDLRPNLPPAWGSARAIPP